MTGQNGSRPAPRRAAGFTLLEVMVAAMLALIVVLGLAAATLTAAKTTQEASRIGVPERAVHEALDLIAADLRANDGAGTYRCGQTGVRAVNGFDVAWRTIRLSLDANGQPREEATCGAPEQQHTLLVRGVTTDGEATVTRETIVSLLKGSAPVIEEFTVDKPQVRVGETVKLTWRLAPDPPAGTATYLDGQRVETDPVTLTGTVTREVVATRDFQLVADSRFGSDSRTVTVQSGDAPIYRVLKTTPEEYRPGQPLTFHWEIDSQPLTLTSARREAANGVSAQNLPTTPGANGRVTGSHTITVPANASGTLYFPFTASNRAGDTRRTIAVEPACLAPVIDLDTNPRGTRLIRRTNGGSSTITVQWSIEHAVTGTYQRSGQSAVTLTSAGYGFPNGDRRETVSVNEGEQEVYTFTVTATNACGETVSESIDITVQSVPSDIPDEGGGGSDFQEVTCNVFASRRSSTQAWVSYSANVRGWSGGQFLEPDSVTGWATFTGQVRYVPSLGTRAENVKPGANTFTLTVSAAFRYVRGNGDIKRGWRSICTAFHTYHHHVSGDSGGGSGGDPGGDSGGDPGGDPGGGDTPPNDPPPPPACYIPPEDLHRCICDSKTGKKVCI